MRRDPPRREAVSWNTPWMDPSCRGFVDAESTPAPGRRAEQNARAPLKRITITGICLANRQTHPVRIYFSGHAALHCNSAINAGMALAFAQLQGAGLRR